MDGFEFVQIIEAELKARKISKQKFYSESGISSATMSQWRNRIYSPSPDNIKKIENFFGITFIIAQKNKPTADYSDGQASEFMELFSRLSPEDQAREIAYLRERLASQDK